MTSCGVCGGVNFVKHAGFFYCSECHTQSQEIHEEVAEFHQGDFSIKIKQKPKKVKPVQELQGTWTSWETFNYILHGLTEELMSLGAPADFDTLILQLWACYLKQCNVAFTSKCQETLPKLTFPFKKRDGKIIHNISTERPKRLRPAKSNDSTTGGELSDSTLMSRSVIGRKRKKMMMTEYEQLSQSYRSDTSASLADETLESLGRSFDSDAESSAGTVSSVVSRRSFTSHGYTDFKRCLNASGTERRNLAKKNLANADHISKSKLLSILHLGLLLTGSEIQLSDLLRFIREGHLSYAKVTHFLPEEMKFGARDVSYINCSMDKNMPTHLNQRFVASKLALLLQIDSLPCPPFKSLTDRYCRELALPEYMSVYVERVVASFPPKSKFQCKSNLKYLTNYDGRAMAIVLFTLKLLFGLDGCSEACWSNIARKINSLNVEEPGQKLFVFEDWVKYLEYRKVVLNDFDFPTMEMLKRKKFSSSVGFLDKLNGEDKDPFYQQRQAYKENVMNKEMLESVKDTLTNLQSTSSHPQTQAVLFPPSLTPQSTKLNKILEVYSDNVADKYHLLNGQPCSSVTLSYSLLNQDFRSTDVKFVVKPNRYLRILKNNNYKVTKKLKEELFSGGVKFIKLTKDAIFDNAAPSALDFPCNIRVTSEEIKPPCKSKTAPEATPSREDGSSNEVITVHKDPNYWVLDYTSQKNRLLSNFNEEILDKTPVCFRWLLLECAAIVEMTPRDLYDELLYVERVYGFFMKVKMNFSKLKQDFENW